MIEVAQGSPGSGKSAVAVARAILHLKKGGVVAANFSLIDGWALEVARKNIIVQFLRLLAPFIGFHLHDKVLQNKAACLYKRFYYVDSIDAIKKIFPRKQAVHLYREKKNKEGEVEYSEGSGLLLLDECQLIFNSRKWEKNLPWIEFFTQHRKLGWNVILIAHSIEMIDSQIRPLAEYESRFRNLQKVHWPLVGIPLSPFPLFLVIKRYAGLGAGASVIASRETFPLPLWAARLYDSLLVFNSETWQKGSEPKNCGAPPAVCAHVPPPPRQSRLVGPHWDHLLMTIPRGSE